MNLEKKEKLDAGGRKKTCKLTLDEYNLIVSGNIEELVDKKKRCSFCMRKLSKKDKV